MNKKNQEITKKKKRKREIMKTIVGLGLLSILAAFGLNRYVINKYKNKIVSTDELDDKKVDCIMVPGAKVHPDGRPCDLLKERIKAGVEAFEAGISDRLLMTGDHGQAEYDEVNAMKSYAMGKNVPEDKIFMDHAGFSTYESMYRAKEIFGVKSMIIVTQGYHLYRALYLANQMGIDAYGIAAEDIENRTKGKREIREVAARVKDVGYLLFRPRPKYLGEKISIRGSAVLTDDKRSNR